MPGRGVRWLIGLAVALPLPVQAKAPSTPPTRIEISYTSVLDRVSPDPRDGITAQVKFTILLHEGGKVEERREARVGQTHRSDEEERRLGPSTGRVEWRVEGKDRLTRTTDYPTHRRIIEIRLTGPTSCAVEVTYPLKPGATQYIYQQPKRGEPHIAKMIRAADFTCTIK